MILGFGSAYIKIENSFVREFVRKLGMDISLGSGMITGVDRKTFSGCFI